MNLFGVLVSVLVGVLIAKIWIAPDVALTNVVDILERMM